MLGEPYERRQLPVKWLHATLKHAKSDVEKGSYLLTHPSIHLGEVWPEAQPVHACAWALHLASPTVAPRVRQAQAMIRAAEAAVSALERDLVMFEAEAAAHSPEEAANAAAAAKEGMVAEPEGFVAALGSQTAALPLGPQVCLIRPLLAFSAGWYYGLGDDALSFE